MIAHDPPAVSTAPINGTPSHDRRNVACMALEWTPAHVGPSWYGWTADHRLAASVSRYDVQGAAWMGYIRGDCLDGRPRFDTAKQAMSAVDRVRR